MSATGRSFVVSEKVLAQTVGDETVLLDLKSEKYFGLDNVGSRFWQLIQETGDIAAIRKQLLDEFEVDAAKLDADLGELLGKLQAAGLISAAK